MKFGPNKQILFRHKVTTTAVVQPLAHSPALDHRLTVGVVRAGILQSAIGRRQACHAVQVLEEIIMVLAPADHIPHHRPPVDVLGAVDVLPGRGLGDAVPGVLGDDVVGAVVV